MYPPALTTVEMFPVPGTRPAPHPGSHSSVFFLDTSVFSAISYKYVGLLSFEARLEFNNMVLVPFYYFFSPEFFLMMASDTQVPLTETVRNVFTNQICLSEGACVPFKNLKLLIEQVDYGYSNNYKSETQITPLRKNNPIPPPHVTHGETKAQRGRGSRLAWIASSRWQKQEELALPRTDGRGWGERLGSPLGLGSCPLPHSWAWANGAVPGQRLGLTDGIL